MDLFKDLLPSILQNKNDVLEEEKEYNAYIVNKALSYHLDTILFANEMNKNHFLDKRLQYDYLRFSIRSKKRPFTKWYKQKDDERLNTIMRFFGYSRKKAEEVSSILSNEQLEKMNEVVTIGGKK